MRCYKCNATLSEQDYCNKCGTDVKIYKKIIRSSEAYYNMGLERAKTRDLSGAADCLRRSIKYNKHNTNARNLLGLVYFEMGEVVAALSEWVISLNLQPEKNIADVYLDKVHRDAAKLDVINQTIKKYNQTLAYAKQNSEDLALIQMKKVLNLYPNLIKGHQLLTLLYINMGDYERALKAITKALKIDRNNPLSLQYAEEIKKVLESNGKSIYSDKMGKGKHIPDNGKLAYVSVPEHEDSRSRADDVSITPTHYKESSSNGGWAILNIIIGIAIGVALTWFLILPNKLAQKDEDSKAKINELNIMIDSKSSTITNLQESITELESVRDKLQANLTSVEKENEIIAVYNNLLEGIDLYMSEKHLAAYEHFKNIDIETVTDETYIAVYNAIVEKNNIIVAAMYYDEGYNNYYLSGDYETSAQYIQIAYDLNPEEKYHIYYLARSLDRLNVDEYVPKAKELYQKVIDMFPDTSTADYAKQYLKNLK
ncbi:MAG: tetratricopeptide repeat protein [Lachnospiraceae bacterium]|nr:tetratricopeptide repeat protein [Lachnospiraceae bacterium]